MPTKDNDKSNIIFYENDDKSLRIKTIIEEDTVWLTQQQLAELFDSSRTNIVEHIQHIYQEKELDLSATCRKFRQARIEGKREVMRELPYYNLDMVIALGYRINSEVATKFRKWATERLKEYMTKGFSLDDERLKQNGGRYFKELLQRIRDIRSSERNFWQQLTDLYATSVDYNQDAKMTREFFATVQNKIHYAVHQQTAAEVIFNRVDAEKPMIGMTDFKGDYITRDDTYVAKNYLDETELQKLNLIVAQYLDLAELYALEEKPMRMADWKEELDRGLKHLNRPILEGRGKISRKQATKKADAEYDKYRKREFENYQSDFDKYIAEFLDKAKKIQEQ